MKKQPNEELQKAEEFEKLQKLVNFFRGENFLLSQRDIVETVNGTMLKNGEIFQTDESTLSKCFGAIEASKRQNQPLKNFIYLIQGLARYLELNTNFRWNGKDVVKINSKSKENGSNIQIDFRGLIGVWEGNILHYDQKGRNGTRRKRLQFVLQILSEKTIRCKYLDTEFKSAKVGLIGTDKVSLEFIHRSFRLYLLMYIGDLELLEIQQKTMVGGVFIYSGEAAITIGGACLRRTSNPYTKMVSEIVTLKTLHDDEIRELVDGFGQMFYLCENYWHELPIWHFQSRRKIIDIEGAD